jgi:hypothetical protein
MPNIEEAASNRTKIADIKRRYSLGLISREQAKLEAEPIIKRINNTGQVIAKKHKVKYYPVDFINLMR